MSMANVINELSECIEHIRENEFNKIPFWGNCQGAMMDALELLKEQPDVVRCKDCKYWNTRIKCRKHPNWFCADGKRKG